MEAAMSNPPKRAVKRLGAQTRASLGGAQIEGENEQILPAGSPFAENRHSLLRTCA